jgi:diguanylate cyclase (GGDEF)-like protein
VIRLESAWRRRRTPTFRSASLDLLNHGKLNWEVLVQLSRWPSEALERALAERELVTLVESDALTGVANRRSFEAILHQIQRSTATISIAYLDVDDFKLVNDTAGHSVGDQVLQAVASRLTKGLREDDVVARLGGDEFAVMCQGAHPSSKELAERLRTYVNGPAVIDGMLIEIGCSVGVASGPGSQASDLLRQADAAMFEAKRARKRTFPRLARR